MSYDLDLEALRRHAGVVDQVAAGVQTARGAAVSTLDPSAFGVMCAFLVPATGLVVGAATLAIDGLAQDLTELAQEVRKMADDYQGVEEQSGVRYSGARQDFSTRLGPV